MSPSGGLWFQKGGQISTLLTELGKDNFCTSEDFNRWVPDPRGMLQKYKKMTQSREIVFGVILELQKRAKRGARITITYTQ